MRFLAAVLLACGVAASAPPTPPVAADDIRDVRGPASIPSAPPWGLYASVATALAFAGAGVVLWRRRRARALRAHERAFASLEEARALSQPREYAIAVSDAVRRYIEERFQVPAGRRTTMEFLESVSQEPPPLLRDHLAPLKELLDFSDRAKFGGWLLAPAEREGMFACAWSFVEMSREADGRKS